MGYLKLAPRRSVLEVMAALLLVIGVVELRSLLLHWSAHPALASAAKLLPLLPVIVLGLVIHRLYRGRERFQQPLMLKSATAVALLSTLFLLTRMSMQGQAMPPVPLHTGNLALAGNYILCGALFQFVDQRAAPAMRQTLSWLIPLLFVLLLAGYWLLGFALPLPPLSFRLSMMLFAAGAIALGCYRIFVRPAEI